MFKFEPKYIVVGLKRSGEPQADRVAFDHKDLPYSDPVMVAHILTIETAVKSVDLLFNKNADRAFDIRKQIVKLEAELDELQSDAKWATILRNHLAEVNNVSSGV